MSYKTYSDNSPGNYTGQVSTSLIRDVPSNPAHPAAEGSSFPVYYDRFINKTSARPDRAIVISDETHLFADFITTTGTYLGYTYLQHRPLNAQSIVVTDGQIATGATDLTNGIVYFKVAPTGPFSVYYLAAPDAYYGDHINAAQNAIMNIQRVLGAGTITGEGLRNVEVWVDSYPPAVQEILPNALHVRGITKDIRIASAATSSGNTITIGGGHDNVTLDVKQLRVVNTDVGLSITGQLGESIYDQWAVYGRVHLKSTGLNVGQGNQNSDVVGSNVVLAVGDPYVSIATGFPMAATGYRIFEERGTIARFFGSIQVIGNIYASGNIFTTAYTTGEQFSIIDQTLVVQQNFRVTGSSILGATTNTTTDIGGKTVIARSLHVKDLGLDINRFDGSIDLYNPGNSANGLGGLLAEGVVPRKTKWFPDDPWHLATRDRAAPSTQTDVSLNRVATVDGLDPSYFAKLLTYRAFDRHAWREDCINEGPRSGYNGSILRATNPATSVFTITGLNWPYTTTHAFTAGAGWNSQVTGVGNNAFRWFHLGGNYYHGKFGNEFKNITGGEFSGSYHHGEGHEWSVLWTQDDTTQNINPGSFKYGSRVPLKTITGTYIRSSPYTVTGTDMYLSRAFSTPASVGDTFMVYHPVYSPPNILRMVNSTTIQCYASAIEPIIGNVRGIHKVVNASCNFSIPTTYVGWNFVYMECDTPESAKLQAQPGSILESNAYLVLSQELAPSDSRVLVGEFYSQDPGYGINPQTIRTYSYNRRFDSLWFRTQNTTNTFVSLTLGSREMAYYTRQTDASAINSANTGMIESPPPFIGMTEIGDVLADNTAQYRLRIQHNFGSRDRAMKADLRVFVAPNIGKEHDDNGAVFFREGPDYTLIQQLESFHIDSSTNMPQYKVVHIDRNFMDIVLYDIQSLPGAVIGSRSGHDRVRDIGLTGSFSTNEFVTQGGPADRNNLWWWTRIVLE